MIGSWGSTLRFRVSESRVMTFSQMQKSMNVRWAKHTPTNGKPISEFQGVDLETVPITITFFAGLGVKPVVMLQRLERAARTGEAEYLVLGKRLVCRNKMHIKSISETFDVVMKRGEIYQASVNVVLEEHL